MDFLGNVLIYGLAVLGLLTLIGGFGAAVLIAYEEFCGRPGSSSLDHAFSATDRLHTEAQQAIRDLQNLGNRRGK
jgi:hypothetical protein